MTVYARTLNDSPAAAEGPLRVLSGAIPAELRGTFLRNGAGLLSAGSDPLNFFDAHGLVAGARFENGAGHFRARLVQTPVLAEERAAKRQTRRRLFTNRPGLFANAFKVDLAPGNGASHDVYTWGGRVVASLDPGHFALDARTLETVGPERWGDVAPAPMSMSPMPRLDPRTGRLVVYVVQPGGTKPDRVSFVELGPGGAVAARTEWATLGAGPAVIHGHAFSGRWHVVAELPARLSPAPALLGLKTLFGSFQWPAGQAATFVVCERAGAKQVRIAAPPELRVAFHILNAFDDGDALVLDVVSYREPPAFEVVAPPALLERTGVPARVVSPMPELWRVTLDVAAGKVVSHTRIGREGTEAANIDARRRGQRHRYVWGPVPFSAGDEPAPAFYGWFHGVGRFDCEAGAEGAVDAWSAGPTHVCSPPAFAPRAPGAAEGDGWLATWVVSAAGESELVLLDAMRVAAGPVARLAVPAPLPAASHNNYVPEVLLG